MRQLLIFAATLLVATLALADQCEQVSTVYAFQDDPPATPMTRRLTGAMAWRGYTLWSDGNGLRVHNGVRELARARLFCPGRGCPGLIRGDYDWVLYNYSTCDACSHLIASGGGPGRQVICEWDRVRLADCYAVTQPTTEGAYVFAHGGSTYAVVTGWPEPWSCGGGTSLLHWQLGDPARIGCVSLRAGRQAEPEPPPWLSSPYVLEQARGYLMSQPDGIGGVSALNGLRLGSSHVGLICSDGWVRVYRIAGSGAGLSLEYRGQWYRGYSHYGRTVRADLDHSLLISIRRGPVSSAEIWDISNPELPVLLSTVNDVPCCYASISYPYAWVGQSANKVAHTIDITDSKRPVMLEQWPEPRNKELYFDAVMRGNGFDVAAFAYGSHADLSGCDRAIFSDGFESGDTSAWSEGRQ